MYNKGEVTTDLDTEPASGDVKYVFGGKENTRIINYADGYMLSFPGAEIETNLKLAELRVQYKNENSILTLSKETSNPYGNTESGWNTYLTEWLNRFIDNADFLAANSINRTRKAATYEDFLPGYTVMFYDMFIRLSKQIERPYYNIAIVRENGVYDKFWNRVMFPILDRNNRVIAFGGRVMGDAKPKYLNSPETMVFDKSRNLYGLNFVHGKQGEGMIICEGYMDVIALHQAGFTNAVASLGTAFTSQHCSLLKRYTDLVYLCYDSDGAGVKAAMRAIPMLKEAGIRVKVINMRPYKDPDEFMKGLSPEAFKERIEQAKSSFFYEVDNLMKEYDMNDPESKTSFMNEVAKKCLTFDNEIERTNYMEAFCREYSVRTEDFKKLVAYHSARMVGIDYEKRRQERMVKTAGQKEDGIAKSQGVFLTWLSNDPVLFEKTKGILSAEDFVDEKQRAGELCTDQKDHAAKRLSGI